MSRPSGRATTALAAYAIGLGVLSADGWRLSPVVAAVASLQGMWGLGAWLAGTRWSQGRVGRGAASGRLLDPAALGHLVMGGALLAEAVFVLTRLDAFGQPGALVAGTFVMILAALWLVRRAWSRSGARAVLATGSLVALGVPVLAVAYLAVQHQLGYMTV